jgi:hypothetical protein
MRARHSFSKLVLAVALFAGISAPASAAPGNAEREMATLLRTVETSSCAFLRNGSRYDGRIAAWHLRGRFQSARDRIGSADEFIDELAASGQSNGERYAVECAGQRESGEAWLREGLANARRAQAAR